MIDTILKLQRSKKTFCLATLVNIRGSAPQDQGAKIIIMPTGEIEGTVGGGKVEAQTIRYAMEKFQSKVKENTFFETWNLQKDVGMTCGGEVSIYFEFFNSNVWNIVVFGAGHISQKLIRILSMLNCNVSLVDNREEWIKKAEGLRNVKTLYLENMTDYVERLKPDDFVVIVTMGHSQDMPILKEIFSRGLSFPYLGVIGSKIKRKVILKELLEYGINECDFICPVGMPIGDNSPAEIAISVTAELLKYKDEFFSTNKRK